MKLLPVAILLVSFYIAAKCTQVPPNVRIWGERKYYDHRLYFKILKRNRSYFSNFGITKEEVFFPNKVIHIETRSKICDVLITFKHIFQNSINTQNITMIKVTDQYSDGKGTKIFLTHGGPGYTYFTLQIESKRFKGYNIILEVYGR